MNCISGAKVYIQGAGLVKADLVFDEVTRGYDAVGSSCEKIDVPSDAVVLPAFIDEHIHGACGFDFSDGGHATERIARALPEEGTAYFLATAMTVERTALVGALKDFGAYYSIGAFDGAIPLGVHLEGPFISAKHIGAQNPAGLSAPDIKYFDELVKASAGSVRLVTLAPEISGAAELIAHAKSMGIRVSVGHTDATGEETLCSGADCATHLFNAMRGIHHRDVGAAGAALIDDGMYVELIADGVHVQKNALALVKKVKPKDKIIFVTDAMRSKGCGDGISSIGGQEVIVKNGEARLKDGTLAGSMLKMNVAFKNAVELMGASIEEASDYCSANPAKHLGVYDTLGGIKEGKAASYVVLGKNCQVIMTIVNGKVVYKA